MGNFRPCAGAKETSLTGFPADPRKTAVSLDLQAPLAERLCCLAEMARSSSHHSIFTHTPPWVYQTRQRVSR